jgi:hypothetical protein
MYTHWRPVHRLPEIEEPPWHLIELGGPQKKGVVGYCDAILKARENVLEDAQARGG